MSAHIISSCDPIGWEGAPYDELTDGPRIARASLQRRFRGKSGEEMRANCPIRPRRSSGFKIGDLLGRLDGRNTTLEIRPEKLRNPGSGAPVITSVTTSSKTEKPIGLSSETEIRWIPERSHWLTLDYYYGERPTP